MKSLSLILISVIVAFSIFSCGGDTDGIPGLPSGSKKSNAELLTQAPWIGQAQTVDPPIEFFEPPLTDIWSIIDPCSQDDLLIFESNFDFSQEEGETTCSFNDPQIIATGSWSFNSSETFVTITPDASSLNGISSFTIVSISETQMIIETTEDFGLGTLHTLTSTFTHP